MLVLSSIDSIRARSLSVDGAIMVFRMMNLMISVGVMKMII